MHERIRKRVEQPFDYDYLHRINMSEAGESGGSTD